MASNCTFKLRHLYFLCVFNIGVCHNYPLHISDPKGATNPYQMVEIINQTTTSNY